MTDDRYKTGQDTKITKSNVTLLVSSVHLYANNTIIILIQPKIFSQNIFKCSVVNNN